jgi:hypothetical protein
MGDYSSYLPVARCINDKKKKKQKTAMMLLDELDSNQQRNCIIAAVVARAFSLTDEHIIIGRQGNHVDAHYEVIVTKISNLKENQPKFFTRMYRLSLSSFDKLLSIIEPCLKPRKIMVKNIVPPIIKLCLGLCMLRIHFVEPS